MATRCNLCCTLNFEDHPPSSALCVARCSTTPIRSAQVSSLPGYPSASRLSVMQSSRASVLARYTCNTNPPRRRYSAALLNGKALPFLELRIELFDLRSSLAVDQNDTALPAIGIPEVVASRPVGAKRELSSASALVSMRWISCPRTSSNTPICSSFNRSASPRKRTVTRLSVSTRFSAEGATNRLFQFNY
jgi:hypothetical protein